MEGPGFVMGNIAKGKDLWDRDEEIRNIWNNLEKSSVLLKAPRRFGKSSIMWNLFENPSPLYKVIFIDTEGMRNPLDFITRLMSEMISKNILKKSFMGWLKKKIPSIDEIGFGVGVDGSADFRIKLKESIGKDWQENGFELISKAKEYDGQILFILDELPLLVQNIWHNEGEKTAHNFLFWFREIRQELPNIRWLVGGSIGIEHILNQIKAGPKVINDFQILNVGPFSETDGRNFIKALLINEGDMQRMKSEVIDEILNTIGPPIPYFLQVLIYESLNEMRRRKKKTLNSEIIKTAYNEGVLGPASRTYFEHYYTRLKDYYDSKIEHIAKRLILEVARKGNIKKSDLFKLFRLEGKGELTDETFSYLMTDIENDFYVSYNPENACYSFTTNLLRDWWLRYYDMVEE